MKKFVFTKKFESEEAMNEFINTYVGEQKYYQARPHQVTIDGLTVTIAITHTKNFSARKRIYDDNGFVMERKDV